MKPLEGRKPVADTASRGISRWSATFAICGSCAFMKAPLKFNATSSRADCSPEMQKGSN
jgi:hypothetical protein